MTQRQGSHVLLLQGALSVTETEQQILSIPPLQDRESFYFSAEVWWIVSGLKWELQIGQR